MISPSFLDWGNVQVIGNIVIRGGRPVTATSRRVGGNSDLRRAAAKAKSRRTAGSGATKRTNQK